MIFLSALLLSMFITIALIPVFTRLALNFHAVDMPGSRKVHVAPKPRSGGIAMALGALVTIAFLVPFTDQLRAIVISSSIAVLCGLVDDFRELGYRSKFAGQIVAALVVILYGGIKIKSLGMLLPEGLLLPDSVAVPLTLLAIVGVTNAINLSDGLDGLAGGICLLTFCCIGYLAYESGNVQIVVVSVAVAGAIFGFLRFNTHPATVFMGDSGSQLLGFLAITLSLSLTQSNAPLSPLLPLILLGFPVLDTLTVLMERVAIGRSPFVGDLNHLHHKLLRLGLYHTEAVFLVYVIQAFLVTSAYVLRFDDDRLLLVGYAIFCVVALTGFYLADKTNFRFKRYDAVRSIKVKLKKLKERALLIKICYQAIEAGIPLLLLFTCLVPRDIPLPVSSFALGFLVMLLVVFLFKKDWFAIAQRFTLYLLIPALIYLSQGQMAGWMSPGLTHFYNLSFGALAVFVILTLKLTRRQHGFKTTPMDFLIIFIAVVIPNLAGDEIQRHYMGLFAAKMIMLFFSYEVLFGESRGEWRKLGVTTAAALTIVAARGLLG